VPGDTGEHSDAFVRDMLIGITAHVSRDMGGGEPAGGNSSPAYLSFDDREVTFKSSATDLGPTNTNLSDERIFSDHALVGGANSLGFAVPAAAVLSQSYARFRVDSGGGLEPNGLAMNGEVEEYALVIDSCEANVTLSDEAIAGPAIIQACDTLTLERVDAEGSVRLRAGRLIEVREAFETAVGATVTFEIDPTLLP
jgi:hypothetical protein